MTQIEQWLREATGLEASLLGPNSLEHAVRLRMKDLGLKRIDDYYEELLRSPRHREELVESVLVTETWFFREPEAFIALAHLVLEEWLPANPQRPIRVLSVPCSSGEEPFAIAMALLDSGLPPARLEIDAIDISGRALAKAQCGVFGKNSFRGDNLAFRDRYFRPAREGFVLDQTVQSRVHFDRGNLRSEHSLTGEGCYDFIFCRNLLIYFDAITRKRALAKIDRLLADSGVLFLGPAEQPLAVDNCFVSANLPRAFACRKAGSTGGPANSFQPSLTAGKAATWHAPALPAVAAAFQLPLGATSEAVAAGGNTRSGADELAEARRLAGAGLLAEAAVLCEAHLRTHRESAEAYYLLGRVGEAQGDSRALGLYRRALYLEPHHHQTLVHMALLAQKNGDRTEARNLQRRAERSQTTT